ncbi:MAG: hypothetical protein NTV57_03150 [Cyanobacteria bacterium]|nr:hypothetical protein [Cyanobacteriota bacterium]
MFAPDELKVLLKTLTAAPRISCVVVAMARVEFFWYLDGPGGNEYRTPSSSSRAARVVDALGINIVLT